MPKPGLEKRIEKNNLPMKIVFALFGLILIGGIYNGTKTLFLSVVISTAPAKNAVLEEKVPGKGLVFVREKTISAPYAGKVALLHKNGERVALTQPIAKFQAFGTDVNGKNVQKTLSSPSAGILLYWWDGLENVFSEDILGSSDIDKLFSAPRLRISKATVGAGETIAKVIDNLEGIYYVIKFPLQQFQQIPDVGDSFEIQFANLTTQSVVKDVKYDAENLYLLTKLEKLPSAFYDNRSIDCIFIKNKYQGVILQKDTLISKNNLLGVYVVESKKAHWKEVTLIGGEGDKVVVNGLESNEIIILNPKWVKENQFIE